MELEFDENEQSDDEIWVDEDTLKDFLKHVHTNRASNKIYELDCISNIDQSPPLMEFKPKKLKSLTSGALSLDCDVINTDESFLIKDKQVEKLNVSPASSESSDELNNTLEFIEYILNNKYQDDDEGKNKDLKLSTITDSFNGNHVKSSLNQNNKKIDPSFCTPTKDNIPKKFNIKTLSCLASEAISQDDHRLHTDNNFLVKDKRVEKLCVPSGIASSSDELNETLESVEYILTKNGTCISVYTCNISRPNINKSDCNFVTPLPAKKELGTPNVKTFISFSIKKPSPISDNYSISSSLVQYIHNTPREALVKDICTMKPFPSTSREC